MRRILKKNALKPWQKRSWCIPKVSGEFVARMEDVLELYAEPSDESRPVVCMDELSKELHGQVAEPVPAEPGRTAKEDYEYARNGTADVFLLICPLLGWRHLEVTSRRGYLQFAEIMKALVDDHFPKAEKIACVGQPEHACVRGVVRGVQSGGGPADRDSAWSSTTRRSTAVG